MSFNMAEAEVYQCTDKSGAVTFTDQKCQTNENKKVINSDTDPKKFVWRSEFVSDELTKESHCLLISKSEYVNSSVRGVDYTDIDIRITEGGIVYIASGTEGLFSNKTFGLGLKVNENDFIRVDEKSSSHLLSFNSSDSDLLIKQMQQGGLVKGRVAFFPYEDSEKDFEIPLSDFSYALEKFEKCKESNK